MWNYYIKVCWFEVVVGIMLLCWVIKLIIKMFKERMFRCYNMFVNIIFIFYYKVYYLYSL